MTSPLCTHCAGATNIPHPVDGQRNGKRRGPSSGGTQGVIWAQGIPFISVLAGYYAVVVSHLRRYRWLPTKKVSHPPRKFDLRLKFSWHHGPPCEGAGYQTISQRQYILEACNWLEPTMFLSRLITPAENHYCATELEFPRFIGFTYILSESNIGRPLLSSCCGTRT
jgi:hypothetical protein